MKWLLILWAGPVLLLSSWYGLSYYDMSFGFFMLTRQTHDLVFQIYGNILEFRRKPFRRWWRAPSRSTAWWCSPSSPSASAARLLPGGASVS